MDINDVLKGQNYNSSYDVIINSFIREYDISKANINVLYQRGVIDKATYDNLYNSDKSIREKSVGLMIRRDNRIYQEIKQGITEAKYQLITENNIDLEDIVSIKNDAVFVMNNKLEKTKFGLIDFKLKNTYTIFLKIDGYEFYYYYNPFNGKEVLDVKGIKDDKLKLHEKYFMDFLLSLFNTLQVEGIISAINMIQNFSNTYINKQLDIEYYRTFNSESDFDCMYDNYIPSILNLNDIEIIDIRYNYAILRNIYGVLLSFYFKKVKE